MIFKACGQILPLWVHCASNSSSSSESSTSPKIKEIKLIGCDVSSDFAQDIANRCKLKVITLSDLHPKYDRYGKGESVLAFNSTDDRFSRGFMFDNEPDSRLFIDHPEFLHSEYYIEYSNILNGGKRKSDENEENKKSAKNSKKNLIYVDDGPKFKYSVAELMIHMSTLDKCSLYNPE